ncbi:hypothetical protein [Chitinasiproducens palmae]|uniref:hypothetical protein n=1 Tax=Chitinasiproducens palmae TaxID=1770053 RepID=UPI000B88FEBB|nr:hypothetical protein [Chitinasiproducens palmae]
MSEEERRAECWERLRAAVRAAKRGDYTLGNALLKEIGQQHGKEARARAKREMEQCVEKWK